MKLKFGKRAIAAALVSFFAKSALRRIGRVFSRRSLAVAALAVGVAFSAQTSYAAEATSSVSVKIGGSTTVKTTTKATKWNCKVTSGTGGVSASVSPTSSTRSAVTTATIKGSSVGTATVKIYSGSTTAGSGTLVKTINVTVTKAESTATATVKIDGTTTKSCTSTAASAWTATSSDETIATVTPTGKSSTSFTPTITGVSAGTTTIIVENDYAKYTITVTVSKKTGDTKSVTMAAGRSVKVECASDVASLWTAKSSNESVATVEPPPEEEVYGYDPMITGVAAGTATITVESEDTIYQISVTVTEPPIELEVGETYECSNKRSSSTSSYFWKYTISDTSVVSASANVAVNASGETTAATKNAFILTLTGLEEGTAKVTVSYKSSSYGSYTTHATYTIEVLAPPDPPGADLVGDGMRISEICPDDEIRDPNGIDSGFIELVNAGEEAVNLADYSIARFNLGKKISAKKFMTLPEQTVQPGERIVLWANEGYIEGGDLAVAAPLMADDEVKRIQVRDGAPSTIVFPAKISPKKSPVVILRKGKKDIDTVCVPSDVTPAYSVIVLDPSEEDGNGATRRVITAKATPGAANVFSKVESIGPNVGPLLGVEPEEDISDNDPVPPAVPGEDYEVTLDVNPVYGGSDADAIVGVTLIYRTRMNDSTIDEVEMVAAAEDDPEHGRRWTAKIPASALPDRGQLIQWKARISDAAGNEWISPSFHNPDDGYEWYGTIVEPGTSEGQGALSDKLPTYHLFAPAAEADTPGKLNNDCLMNKDYDDVSSSHPLGARVAIYDSTTSRYYDNVRIDLRGNSSSYYNKKSHGLRFAKSNPLKPKKAWKHPVSGEKIKDVRKTSFIAEYCDPSYIRQLTSFWVMNESGVWAPMDEPVRVNLNGAFYQLGFLSPRFTDNLIEDIYCFDKLGYSYKNVGAFHLGVTDDTGRKSGTSAGAGTKKKTPDDGDEQDTSVLDAFIAEIDAAGKVAVSTDGSDSTGLENAQLTAKVVERFDLPAWFNYLAATRITQEGDDVWGNLSAYYDHADLIDGTSRGSGTWRPLCWDMNCSFGQFYHTHGGESGRIGCIATSDWNKCHPLYGGVRIRAWKADHRTIQSPHGDKLPNYAVESIFQHEKYRRLYLRRLRTLMDKFLLAPSATANDDSPLVQQIRANAALIQEESVKDRALWGHLGENSSNTDCTWVNCWGAKLTSAGGLQPVDANDGARDIIENYINPRRTHLYVTHSATNTAKKVGYAVTLNAGIPESQSPVAGLAANMSVRYDASVGAVVIENANDETIDLSDWTLGGPVMMTLPKGTVIDSVQKGKSGEVYVTADRVATIAKMSLVDQIVVGNGAAGDASSFIVLVAPDGTIVTNLADSSKEIANVGFDDDGNLQFEVRTNSEIMGQIKPDGTTVLSASPDKLRKFLVDNGIAAYTAPNTTAEAISAALRDVGANGFVLWQDYALGIEPDLEMQPTVKPEGDVDPDAITLAIAGVDMAAISGDYDITYKVVADGKVVAETNDPSNIKVPITTGRYKINVVFKAKEAR